VRCFGGESPRVEKVSQSRTTPWFRPLLKKPPHDSSNTYEKIFKQGGTFWTGDRREKIRGGKAEVVKTGDSKEKATTRDRRYRMGGGGLPTTAASPKNRLDQALWTRKGNEIRRKDP